MKRLVVIAVLAVVGVAAGYLFLPFDRTLLRDPAFGSLTVRDRNGLLLREIPSAAGTYGRWVPLKDVSPFLVKALVSAEDRRFFEHRGIDPAALLRAVRSNLRKGSVVSGASTITQQLARIVRSRPRTWASKLLVMADALRLEIRFSKEEILEAYVNRLDFGNLACGVDAASRTYFHKSPSLLSLAEAALLAGLVKAPGKYTPYRNPGGAHKRMDYVLGRMKSDGVISEDEKRSALAEPLRFAGISRPFKAPHFCRFVLDSMADGTFGKNPRTITSTLDSRLQEETETIVRARLAELRSMNVTNAAVVAMDATGDILVMAGSGDFFDEATSGQVNGAIAIRQPGSTIKPFTYGLALEEGMKPSDVVPDVSFRELSGDTNLMVRNYDGLFHGPVRLRTALACSYNIPAVRLLMRVGEENLLQRLRGAGFASLRMPSEFYRLGLTLGDGDVTLLELVRAYGALGRGGISRKERAVVSFEEKDGKTTAVEHPQDGPRIFSPQVSYLITDILQDNNARTPAFGPSSMINLPFPCAVKTGTSTNYRDNWTIGYTPRVTVGVWVGNFDGSPMNGVSGITGAGSIFRDVMMMLWDRMDMGGDFPLPDGIVKREICPVSGDLAGPYCAHAMTELFVEGNVPSVACTVHAYPPTTSASMPEVHGQEYRRWVEQNAIPAPPAAMLPAETTRGPAVVFPADGDVFQLVPGMSESRQAIRLKALAASNPDTVTWWIDGVRYGESPSPYDLWWRLVPGQHTFRVTAHGSHGGGEESGPVSITVYGADGEKNERSNPLTPTRMLSERSISSLPVVSNGR